MNVRNSIKRPVALLLVLLLLVAVLPQAAIPAEAANPWDWYWSLMGTSWTSSTDNGDPVWTAASNASYMQYWVNNQEGRLATAGSIKGEFCSTVAGSGAQFTSITLITGSDVLRVKYYRPLHQVEVSLNGQYQSYVDWADADAIPVGQWYTMEVKWDAASLTVYLNDKHVLSYEYTGIAINNTTMCQIEQNGLLPSVKNLTVSLETAPWDSAAWTAKSGSNWTATPDGRGSAVFAPSGSVDDPLRADTLCYSGNIGATGGVQADFRFQKRPTSTDNVNAYAGFVLRNPDGSNLSFQYQTCYEQLVFKQSNVTQNWIQQPKTLPTKEWVTFGIKWDTEKVYLYINGELRFGQAYSDFTIDENTVCEIVHYGTYAKVKNIKIDGVTDSIDKTLLSLKENLTFKVLLPTAAISGEDNVLTFTKYASDGSVAQTLNVPQTQWTMHDADNFKVSLPGVTAKEMGSRITASIQDASGKTVSFLYQDSVKDYLQRLWDAAVAEDNAKLKTLAVDLLNYGAAAQTIFNHDTTNLVNADLTTDQTAAASQTAPTLENKLNKDDEGGLYYGTTLLLKDELQLRFVFQNIQDGMYAKVSYTNHAGNVVVTDQAIDLARKDETYHTVTVNTLAMADYNTEVTVTIYNSDNTVAAVVTDTMAGYLNRADNAAYAPIAKAMAAAYAYLHQ